MTIKLSERDTQQITDLLVGRRIVATTADTLTLDNGAVLTIVTNGGCGGCSSGWYQIDHLDKFDNVITRVKVADEVPTTADQYAEDPHRYSIFVYSGKKTPVHEILAVSGDDGNGYYGTGYEIWVTGVNA